MTAFKLLADSLETCVCAAVAQADMDAMRFGAACNGILRADACVYQELFFGTADADCIDGDLEGST